MPPANLLVGDHQRLFREETYLQKPALNLPKIQLLPGSSPNCRKSLLTLFLASISWLSCLATYRNTDGRHKKPNILSPNSGFHWMPQEVSPESV